MEAKVRDLEKMMRVRSFEKQSLILRIAQVRYLEKLRLEV